MWNIKKQMNKQQKQTHRYREQTDGCLMEGDIGGLGKKGEDIKKYTLAVTK